jgi:putative inorganic carbon (HCO3(-)) transporter
LRGLLFSVLVLGLIPFAFSQPFVGVLLWLWISLMVPHQLVYGPLATLPYALIVAVITLISWLISREPKTLPPGWTTWLIIALMCWISLSSIFGLAPGEAIYERWLLSEKMLGFCLVTFALITNRLRVNAIVWMLALSIGYFGVKGGLYTLATGGAARVYGPGTSMISDNNDLGVALNMTLPLIYYLSCIATTRLVKFSLWGFMGLTAVAILFTYSRGALLGICAMTAFLVLKSRHRIKIIAATVLTALLVYNFAPQSLFARWGTIEDYETETSAASRLYLWQLSFAIAEARPVAGAGFRAMFFPETINQYARQNGLPELTRARAAHSIWFEMMADHGFVGLAIFVLIGLVAWRNGSWLIRNSKGQPTLSWANDLGRMIQVALVGYAVGGSFASMPMYDGFYDIVIVAAAARHQVRRETPPRNLGLSSASLPK